jgi:hypothetical protein
MLDEFGVWYTPSASDAGERKRTLQKGLNESMKEDLFGEK